MYDAEKPDYVELQDIDDLANWFPHDPRVLTEVMYAFGGTPEIDP